MRIISKTKDYYDGMGVVYGIDPMITYVRQPSDLSDQIGDFLPKDYRKIVNHHFSISRDFVRNNSEFSKIEPFIIGFCGKGYIGWKIYKIKKNDIGNEIEYIHEISYDAEYVLKKIIQKDKYGFNSFQFKWLKDSIDLVLSKIKIDTFKEIHAPIFVLDGHNFIANPSNLKDYKFYKIFDGVQAFQEISMFIASNLNDKENIIEIEDKYKKEQHGMDKWSFRNPDPPKRKKNK